MSVTFDDVRGQMLTMDRVNQELSGTDSMEQVTFDLASELGSQAPKFKVRPGWAAGIDGLDGDHPIQVFLSVKGHEYQFTKDGFLDVVQLMGLSKKYAVLTPDNLLQPHLDYWHRSAAMPGERKLFVEGDVVQAVVKGTVTPFSNVRLLHEVTDAVEGFFGQTTEIMADYKFHHDLRATVVRLVTPIREHHPREGDPWCIGIEFRNSLTGRMATSLQGYLLRYECTNGMTSVHATSGSYSRKRGQGEEVYEWARAAVDDVLGDLEHEFEAVDELAKAPIEKDLAAALEDIYATYRIPGEVRSGIIDTLVRSDDQTMYGIQAAISAEANRPLVSEAIRIKLLEVAGDLGRAYTERCAKCRRLPVEREV